VHAKSHAAYHRPSNNGEIWHVFSVTPADENSLRRILVHYRV